MSPGSNESCPTCRARMAADQRYCLNCGNRRGEPRLPFMDAVVLMEAAAASRGAAAAPPPPPAAPRPSRMNANAALIAGVATLVLAIGVGFLIGRSGHTEPTQAAAPQVIKVEGGGGGETAAVASAEERSSGNKGGGKSNGGGKSSGKSALNAEGGKATAKAKKNSAEGAHGQSEAVENVLHTESGVELESEVEVGGKCKQGTAGCEGGKFTGNFFGE